jgi:hypothetical protein
LLGFHFDAFAKIFSSVMASMPVVSAVDHEFKSWLGQAKEYVIFICFYMPLSPPENQYLCLTISDFRRRRNVTLLGHIILFLSQPAIAAVIPSAQSTLQSICRLSSSSVQLVVGLTKDDATFTISSNEENSFGTVLMSKIILI